MDSINSGVDGTRIWEAGRPPRPLDAVGVVPWLDLSEPVVIGPVVVYPMAEGLEHLGSQRSILEEQLRMYRPAWEGARPVRPSIVLHLEQLSEGITLPADDMRRAIDIFFVAASVRDNSYFTVNATTFQLYFQHIGGGGANAFRVRRRNGYVLSGGINAHIAQPVHAGTYLAYWGAVLDALVRCIGESRAYHLFEALAWYRRASSDSDYTDRDIDRVLLRTAVDWLVATPSTPMNGATDWPRLDALLQPFTLQTCEVGPEGNPRSYIRCALWVLNEDRNGTLHPRGRARQQYAFEQRPRILLDWIADRCFCALLIARLVELGVLPLTDETRAYVEGVDQWLADPAEDDLSKVQLQRRGHILTQHFAFELIAGIMDQVDLDLDNPEFRASFYERLGGQVVDGIYTVNLYWRRDRAGLVVQILEQLPRALALRDVIEFAPDETPEDAAAAVRRWCDDAGVSPKR